jgi:hypothetical protein
MSQRVRFAGGTLGSLSAAALLLLLSYGRLVAAASPVEREAAIVSRALAFERTLDSRVGRSSIGIAVIHKPQDAASERCGREWREGFSALANVKIQDRNVTLTSLPYNAEAVSRARSQGVDVFIVCSGLTQESNEISRASRAQHILTVGTLLPYVEQNMAFGVFQEQGKYHMVVNLRVAAAEGVSFSSSMLKLARVLR